MTSLLPDMLHSNEIGSGPNDHCHEATQEKGEADLKVKRFDSFEEALQIREEWDNLVERTGGDVFNTFDWCATWWKYFGKCRKLILIAVRSDDDLVAVWPLFRETIWWGPVYLRVVRVVGCDHGVTTCNLSTELAFLVPTVHLVLSSLEAQGPWDLFHVGEIPGYARHIPELAAALQQSQHVDQVCWDNHAYPQAAFDVPHDYEAYLAGLSLKERRNVRHDERELAKRSGEYVEPRDMKAIDTAFDMLIDLHQKHWRARGRHGLFQDVPGIESFYREVAKMSFPCGRLALLEVRSPDGVLASEYALRFNHRLHWIIGGRRENVSSRIGFCGLMRGAVQAATSMIDGLAGEYDYKRRLGARELSIKTIFVYPRSKRGRARLRLTRWAAQIASLLYHRIWYWHASPWLAKRLPHLSSMLVRPGVWEGFARSKFLVVGRPTKDAKGSAPMPGEPTEA